MDLAALAAQPVLSTARLRLRQAGPEDLDAVLQSLSDPDARRLTGTHAEFNRAQVLTFLTGLPGRSDRADYAITDAADGRYLGEVVLNGLDLDNRFLNYRISLAAGALRGRGYGTEAGRAVVDWAFDVVGVHRIGLDVFDFNPMAQRSYEKIGFRQEGFARDTLFWDGQWAGSVLMGMLATDPRPGRD